MPNQFLSPEGDLENYFVDEYWLIDQYVGDQLWGWGIGNNGQFGNAQLSARSTPVTTFAGGTNWEQVSAGNNHTAAIKTDGTLWAWGFAGTGRLGNGVTLSTTYISTPVTTFAGGNNWKQVSCTSAHTAAIKTDGTLWTWGSLLSGKLGNAIASNTPASTPITTFAGGTNWKQVSAGTNHTAAIKTDGTLWTWGTSGSGTLGNASAAAASISTPVTTFAGGNNWKQVSSGSSYTAAIKTDGTLWTWGYGVKGQLGNGVLLSVITPITTFAGGTNWKQVSCGDKHMAAIKTDGTLWTWGYDNTLDKGNIIPHGALGINNTVNLLISTPVTTFAGGTNWKQVDAGYAQTAAIKTDGTLWTWGYGTNGRLGNAKTDSALTPVTTFAGGTNWKQLSSGGGVLSVQAGINAEYPLS